MLMPYQLLVNAYRPLGQGIPNVNGYSMGGGGYATYPPPFGYIGGLRPSNYGNGEYVELSDIVGWVTDQDIYQTIARTMSAGTTAWTSISDTVGEETANAGDMLDTNFYLDLSLLATEDLPVIGGGLATWIMTISAAGNIQFGTVATWTMRITCVGAARTGPATTGTAALPLLLKVKGSATNGHVPISMFITMAANIIQNVQPKLGDGTFVLGTNRLGILDTAIINGIVSYGGAGSLTINRIAQPRPTGIFATGYLGTFSIQGARNVSTNLPSIQSTSGVGSPTAIVGDSSTLTGISSTHGATAPSVSIGPSPSGIHATGMANQPSVSGSSNVSLMLPSISATGGEGNLTASFGSSPSLTGVSSTSGETAPSGMVSANAIGVQTTGGTGTLKAQDQFSLTGISSTSGVGTLGDTLMNSVTLTGISTSVLAHAVTVQDQFSLSGVHATGGMGTLSFGTPANITGVSSTTGATAPTATNATIKNIHIGLSAWSNQTYSVGNRVSNSSNAYQCIVAGTSTAAPTGTGSSIAPGGTSRWKWLSAIDYTSLSAWAAGIPATLTVPVIGWWWNDSIVTTTSGTTILTLTGHTTTSTNTITLAAAPGDSFRDNLFGGQTALAFNTANGVSVQLPASGVGNTNYFDIEDDHVFIRGIQFQDPNSGSGSDILACNTAGHRVTLQDCIFDGYGQFGAALIGTCTLSMFNCLVVDRQALGASVDTVVLFDGSNSTIINCTFVSTSSGSAGTAINADDGTGQTGNVVKNCIFMGYGPTFKSTTGFSIAVDHCVFSDTSVNTGATDDGGNLVSKTAANQFVNTATDFRIKTTADAHGAGVVDTSDIPTADDIVGDARGATWDAGCFQFK